MQTATYELDEVIKQNSNLVYSICSKYQGYTDKEDLHQVGMIGLINAYKNYNQDKGVKFSTYAFPYIVGEVSNYVRENKAVKVSRDLVRLGRKINEYIAKHLQVRGYEPTTKDIALMLDVGEDKIISALDACKKAKSLDEEINDNGKTITLLDVTPAKEKIRPDCHGRQHGDRPSAETLCSPAGKNSGCLLCIYALRQKQTPAVSESHRHRTQPQFPSAG